MKGLKLIGKGAFTKAYLDSENNVILHSSCPIKECMSMGWFPDSPLFPEIERLDGFEEYKMKYYPKVSSLKQNLDPDQWTMYKALRALRIVLQTNVHMNHSAWYEAFTTLEDRELSETMCAAIEACASYGSDIGFEISPRNVACENGKLILLDCFYSISKLKSVTGR